MGLPWVSRGQYDAVLAAKDAMIGVLKEQIIALEQRLSAPISVSVNLPEGFAVQMPAVVGRRPKRQQDQNAPGPAVVKEVDWANVDPNDNVALARLAADELGTMVSPSVLAQTISRIKMNIRAAREDKLRRALTEGKVGTVSRPLTEEEAIEQGPAYVPAEIRKLVESAERG